MNPREDGQGPSEEPRGAAHQVRGFSLWTSLQPAIHTPKMCVLPISQAVEEEHGMKDVGCCGGAQAPMRDSGFTLASSLEGPPGFSKSTGRERPLVSEQRQCSSGRGGGTKETAQGTRAP